MKVSFLKTLFYSLGYFALVVACLVRWHGPGVGMGLDIFAGSYLVLRLAGVLHSLISSFNVFRSAPIRDQWWALDSEPEGPRWVMLLMAFDLAVFLDYGHWRLVPALANPVLQTIGLGLYLLVTIWQIWTDNYLARFFNDSQQDAVPMNVGPYRYVRHPRYTAAILGKIAVALALASVVGWVLVVPWAFYLTRKMTIEEGHLQKQFGMSYDAYKRTTAKLIPGLY